MSAYARDPLVLVMLAWLLGAKTWMLLCIPALNVLIWTLTIYLDPQRQFLHDRIAGTRLIWVTSTHPKERNLASDVLPST